jgi:hypothetical protein
MTNSTPMRDDGERASQADSVLVRVLRGVVGWSHLEDGYLVKVPAATAAELIAAGDAVMVGDGAERRQRGAHQHGNV